jgi:hypothetical protein
MKLKLNNVEDILQTEITWCLDHPDTNLTMQEQIGFMNGLRQAQIIIRNAEYLLKGKGIMSELNIKSQSPQLIMEIHKLREQLELVQAISKGLAKFNVNEGDVLLVMEKENSELLAVRDELLSEKEYWINQLKIANEQLDIAVEAITEAHIELLHSIPTTGDIFKNRAIDRLRNSLAEINHIGGVK